MKTVSWSEFIANPVLNPEYNVTIGVFDGLHRGHIALLNNLKESSLPAVFTFTNNPERILNGNEYPGDILTLEQKVDGLSTQGIDLCVLIDFSREFSKITGEQFILSVINCISVKKFVVGQDFRCGRDGGTGIDKLQEICGRYSLGLEIVEHLNLNGVKLGSSRIRNLIKKGLFNEIHDYFVSDREYILELKNLSLQIANNTSLYNLEDSKQVFPNDGTFDAYLYKKGKKILSRITIQDKCLIIEGHGPLDYCKFVSKYEGGQ